MRALPILWNRTRSLVLLLLLTVSSKYHLFLFEWRTLSNALSVPSYIVMVVSVREMALLFAD